MGPIIKRQQLFEIQDFSWTPEGVRNGITDYLQFILKETGMYWPILPYIMRLLQKSNHKTIIDLCSGGGGPIVTMAEGLNAVDKKYQIILTDLYPNTLSFHYHQKSHPEIISYSKDAIDATNVPREMPGVRTLFTSFHHFNDIDAKSILKDAYKKKTPIGIFEFTDRTLLTFLLCLPSFLGMFFLMPLVRPFKWSNIFWTYIIPLIPLITLWDISASVLRTRNVQELKDMVADLNNGQYIWEIGKIPTSLKFNIIYLLGYPKSNLENK